MPPEQTQSNSNLQDPQVPHGQTPPHLVPKITDTITNAPEPEKEGLKSIFSTVAIIVVALMTALFLTSYVFQYYQVDGESMETTLQNGDRLVVWKVPRTIARVTNNDYIPNRGDVVIFNEAGLNSFSDPAGNKQLIKRVIALPGEKVVVGNGKVTVFNKENPSGFIPDDTLPYNSDKHIAISDGEGTYVLGDNEIFVCGDNRGNSLDSRFFGPISADQIVGKLVFRILPLDKAQLF